MTAPIVLTYGQVPDRAEWLARVRLGPDGFEIVSVDQAEIDAVVEAVNQGIDAHLEAVACEPFIDKAVRRFPKWGLRVLDSGSLHTLVRRLVEIDSEPALELASSILAVEGYEWV